MAPGERKLVLEHKISHDPTGLVAMREQRDDDQADHRAEVAFGAEAGNQRAGDEAEVAPEAVDADRVGCANPSVRSRTLRS